MSRSNFIAIAEKNRHESHNICSKFFQGAQNFANKSIPPSHLPEFIEQVDSVLTKFLIAGVNLEYLWEIHWKKKEQNPGLDSNSLKEENSLEWENSFSFVDCVFLDNFVCQARSFIDHTMNLSLLTLLSNKKWYNRDQFNTILLNINTDKTQKLIKVYNDIFEIGYWAYNLNKIRKDLVHNKIYQSNSKFKPKIANMELQNFGQYIENHMFELLTKIYEILFEDDWQTGYKEKL